MSVEIKIFQIIVLVFSAVIHEYMHGWMADRLGDPTAKNEGRLTLSPIPHIDLFGSVLLPFLLVVTGSNFVLGWAKPVPYNPYNLRDQKYGELKVALAGPMANFITALFFGLLIRFFGGWMFSINPVVPELLSIIVFINLLLMIFNLIPIPPLDGSKILMTFLSYEWKLRFQRLEPYGIFIILFLIMFGFFSLIWPLLIFLFSLIVGFQ